MGTRRRVAIWTRRGRNEFLILSYPGKPKNIDCVFRSQDDMVAFARSARLVLKEKVVRS